MVMMEDGNQKGLILWLIIGIAVLAACGVISAVLILLAWIAVL